MHNTTCISTWLSFTVKVRSFRHSIHHCAGAAAKRPVQDTAGKEQASLQHASSVQQEASEQQHDQTQQASQDPAQQQYTAEEWNAYWQYYGMSPEAKVPYDKTCRACLWCTHDYIITMQILCTPQYERKLNESVACQSCLNLCGQSGQRQGQGFRCLSQKKRLVIPKALTLALSKLSLLASTVVLLNLAKLSVHPQDLDGMARFTSENVLANKLSLLSATVRAFGGTNLSFRLKTPESLSLMLT